jgi:hypothetical protein
LEKWYSICCIEGVKMTSDYTRASSSAEQGRPEPRL